MTNLEQFEVTRSTQRTLGGPALFLAKGRVLRSNVVSIETSASRRRPELVKPVGGRRLMGRKGRIALAKRKAVDGAFLTVAVAAVVLIWWSSL